MSRTLGSRNEMILPEDFARIESVFQEIIGRKHIALDSEEADVLAARLISLFQSGIHDHEALTQMVGYPKLAGI